MTHQNAGTIDVPTTSVATARAVTFEAQELDTLARQVTVWLLANPSLHPLAFSHATETRYVIQNPVSLAGSESRLFYTGVLLTLEEPV